MTGSNGAIPLLALTDDHAGWTIGGKAAGLVPLAAAGLPVPDAVALPAEADAEDLDALAADLAIRFSGSALAVRSSGGAEDLNHASFAGQYGTVLGVPAEPGAVAAAVRRVRASATDSHVASYAAGHDTAMAVLVMPMVDADAAGIAFTRDPITGARVVVIEAVRGLGDRLASGEETGERWTVDSEPRRHNDLGVLDPGQVLEIAELARRCEEIAATPQDIEWASPTAGPCSFRRDRSRRSTGSNRSPATTRSHRGSGSGIRPITGGR
jgi:pyruvate,water dikinase